MFKRFFKAIKDTAVEERKFILILLFTYIICMFPVNYYIIVGGGTSDIDSRIKVEDGYKSRGSFNISYVTELQGRLAPYLLSFVIPDWKSVPVSDYKYDDNESIEDISFRNDLDLKMANANAIRWAFKLADKEINVVDTKVYVIALINSDDNNFKIGDQILDINGKSFDNLNDYRSYIQTFKESDILDVKVIRNKMEQTIKARLHWDDGSLVMGVGLAIVRDYETDPVVQVKFEEDETGPSGGLITTLAIYNKLVEEDITKSLKIAGTGTIEEDGTIGEIGGVKYKLLGAAKDGADVFLVPSGDNYSECVELKKKKNLKIRIIGVSNIEEARELLEDL